MVNANYGDGMGRIARCLVMGVVELTKPLSLLLVSGLSVYLLRFLFKGPSFYILYVISFVWLSSFNYHMDFFTYLFSRSKFFALIYTTFFYHYLEFWIWYLLQNSSYIWDQMKLPRCFLWPSFYSFSCCCWLRDFCTWFLGAFSEDRFLKKEG